MKRLRELALRWNALAHELQLEAVPGDKPEGGLAAAQSYALYLKVKAVVNAEGELCTAASHVFPNWAHAREVADNTQRLAELEKAFGTTSRRTASPTSGLPRSASRRCWKAEPVASSRTFAGFSAETLGNPEIEDARDAG